MAEQANQGHVQLSPGVNLDQPSAARIYDYMLGGYQNFEIDRQVADKFTALLPDFSLTARVNRAFLRRAATIVARQGIDQFLDLGSGIPTVGNVHEIVRQYQPEARTVYVDIDPVAIAHAEILLQDDPDTVAVLADVRRPDDILGNPRVQALIDFTRPVGLVAVALLHYILDDDEAENVIDTFKNALPSGSYVAIGVWTYDDAPREIMEQYAEMTHVFLTPGAPRPREKVLRYFRGLDLLEPGLVHGPQWRPDGPDDLLVDEPGRGVNWVGVARKP
ncbi:MAG: SAM-dependent methyltransferase [Candidatus Promineofilum sp.]|nr:SAM-dependent methyltransferase [Promineifilum sp.]